MPNTFTQEWYATADENELLALTHTYDEGLSALLIHHKERRNPKAVYAVKDGIVRLTDPLVLFWLKKYGYSELS